MMKGIVSFGMCLGCVKGVSDVKWFIKVKSETLIEHCLQPKRYVFCPLLKQFHHLAQKRTWDFFGITIKKGLQCGTVATWMHKTSSGYLESARKAPLVPHQGWPLHAESGRMDAELRWFRW